MKAAGAALLFALGACTRAAPTGPVPDNGILVDRSTKTYQVDMTSQASFNASVFAERGRADQSNWVGRTNSNIKWAWVSVPSTTGCSLTDVKVTVTTVMSLPRWTPPSNTSPARREWWSRVELLVTQHERRHVQISEDGGRAIAAALRDLKGGTCTALRERANTIANREYERMRTAQATFDRTDGQISIPAMPR